MTIDNPVSRTRRNEGIFEKGYKGGGNTTFSGVAERIAERFNSLIGDSVKRTLNKVQKRMDRLQQEMMPYIGKNLIDIPSQRIFPGITIDQPKWPGHYNKAYRARKEAYLGSGGKRLLMLTGALKRYFLSARTNVERNFGRPLVTLNLTGRRKSVGSFTKNSSGDLDIKVFDVKGIRQKSQFQALPKSRFGDIEVDLYPRVKGKLYSGMVMGDYFPISVAYKLDTPFGERHYEFMPQFMQWWLNVKAKQALKGALT